MVKLTGNVREFAKQRMHVGALKVDGVEFFAKNDAGNRWFVDSSASAGGDGTSPDGAFDTLDEAFAACTANNGDVIYVMPNHAETITGAGGITHDVAGVSVMGIGFGGQEPRFLMDGGTSVTYVISAADAVVQGLRFAAGHADIVTCFDITAANANVSFNTFEENTAGENFLTEIKATSTTNNNADGLTVEGNRVLTIDAAGLEFIEINADVDALVVRDNTVIKDGATAAKLILVATGKDLTNIDVGYNDMTFGTTSGDLIIQNDTAVNSGVVHNNTVGHHIPDTAAVVLVDCDGVREWKNVGVKADSDTFAYDNPILGKHVQKSGDISSAPDALFDVTGKVMVMAMVGEVTSVIATSTSMSLNTSTNDQVLAASTQITTDALGTLYLVSGDPDLGFNGGGTPGVDAAPLTNGALAPFVVNDDQIEMNVNSAGTGLVQWDLWYVPLEPGAYAVAAA